MRIVVITLLLTLGMSVAAWAQQSDITPATAGTVYGKELKKSGAKSVKSVEKALEKSEKFTGKLEGKVTRVCTSKGCWLALQSDDSDQPVVVRFKDYGFFVPQDIEGMIEMYGGAEDIVGKTVVVEGYAKTKEKEDKDGNTVKDISFTADGVLVVK